MPARLQRAQLLIQQGRFEMAQSELGMAMADDPDNGLAHALMAICLIQQQKFAEATELAQQAIGLKPDDPFTHSVLAQVWARRNYMDRAQDSIDQAIRLDPHDADYHALLGQILLAQKKWSAADTAGAEALALDPEHVDALNVRATAKRKLGDRGSATDELAAALEVNPDDPWTHANSGWSYLENGQLDKAEQHFREALRLDPELEWARVGIIETLKARNPLYRGMLKYFLWMQSLSGRAQWIIVLGAFFAYRYGYRKVQESPELGIVLWPLLWGYILFVVCSWFAVPLANLLLRIHPFGRLALSKDERRCSNWVGLSLLCVAITLMCAFLLPSITSMQALWCSIYLAVAIAMATLCSRSKPRRIMTYYAIAVAGAAFAWLTSIALVESGNAETPGAISSLWLRFGMLCHSFLMWSLLISIILCNILNSMQWRDEPSD